MIDLRVNTDTRIDNEIDQWVETIITFIEKEFPTVPYAEDADPFLPLGIMTDGYISTILGALPRDGEDTDVVHDD